MRMAPKLMTGRMPVQLGNLFLTIVALLLAFGPLVGLTVAEQFGLLHGVLFLGIGIVLILEVTVEGERTSPDMWSLMDWIALAVGLLVGLTGLSTLTGVAFGFTFLSLPAMFQSVVMMGLAVLMGREALSA